MSGGRDHAGYNALGARVLGSDPDVEWSGTDAGYALSDDTLRAPDMAVDPAALKGGPGWIRGAPPLAVEYAGIGQDEEDLKAKIGFFAILHTWGQKLDFHPHLHCVVPGGGIALDGSRWVSCPRGFFMPVKLLNRMFRGKFLALLQAAQNWR